MPARVADTSVLGAMVFREPRADEAREPDVKSPWEGLHDWLGGGDQKLLHAAVEAEVTELLGRVRYQRRATVDGPAGGTPPRVPGPADFEERKEGGVFLTKEAFRRFLAAYGECLGGPGPAGVEGGWRAAFREQVGRLVRAVRWGPV